MGFFKKLFGDAADELKKNLEDAKNEMLSNLEEVKQDVMGGFINSTSNSRDGNEEDDEEPKILLGDFHDGVLTIREGITELDDESLEHYKRIRKITFPASLERLDSNVIDEQERLEELDFSKVTKLKTIPDDFISGENKVRKLIIPNGVTEVGDGFLGEAKSGAEIFVPDSVRKLGYITGNNDNDMTVYLFAANIDISDVEEDVKTLYVLPQYYGWYAKALKKCDSEARLREMPEEMMGVYGATSLGELKEIAKDNASLTEDSKTESVDDNITDIVQKIKEKLQALDLSSFILYGNDYEGDREYEEVEQLGDEGLLESSSEYAINYDDSYDGNSSVYTKVRKIEIQESGVTFDIEEIYEDNDGDEESRGFHEAQTIDRILESCNRDAVERGLGNILTYLDDETLIKLNKNTENEAKPEPLLEPKPEPKAETKVEVEQKEEPIENNGLFSARLEAMIAAALQDGVLTDKERELLKRRVEKEGEDWDEVEMIIEARLAEMNPVASTPSSETLENNNVSQDTTPQDNKNTTPQDVSSKADNEYPETILEYKIKKLDALRNAQSHKNDSEQARQIWKKAVSEIKMIDRIIIRDGVKSVDELKLKLQKEQMKLQMEEQAKEKEQMKLQTILDYSEAERYSNERNVDIPEGYIELGEECFQDRHLQSICLPSTLEKINDSAFERCNKMKKVDFSKCTSLIEIGDNVFHACTKLEEIVLPDSVTTIGDGAFNYCTKLRKIVMPSSLEKLGDSVFENCDSLEEVDMSKVTKLTTIPKRFETGDDKQMVIPMGVTTIRKDAFEYCNMYALFLPPTLKDYMDTHGNWESVYLFASPLEKMDNIFENSNNLYVLPQYLEVYKSIHEALGEYSWCEIHTMPDEFMFFYDN